MDITAPTTQPFMMVVTADGRTPSQLVDATRTMIEQRLDTAKTGVSLASLGHLGALDGGHILGGALTGPSLAVHDAITALGQLGTAPGRTEEAGLPVGPGTVPTAG